VTVDWPTIEFPALGTTAVLVVTDPAAMPAAHDTLRAVVADVDASCSRFRDDSELMAVNRAGGRPVSVSDTLRATIETALWAAEVTDGLVDPTVGDAVRVLGYDRDFAAVSRFGAPVPLTVTRVPGWRSVELRAHTGTVVVPRGVQLDLGATAKAWCADRAARLIAHVTGVGALVSLGGDVAVAGPPPPDGWVVRIADRHDAPPREPGPMVAIAGGGVATSGTAARRWWRGDALVHHIVDPSTGRPAATCWRTATVAAATCLDANVAATAAIVLGAAAPTWLADRCLTARLVSEHGTVEMVGGWPDDEAGPTDSPTAGRAR
jgi:thiamine biosynthesis lipoprotein